MAFRKINPVGKTYGKLVVLEEFKIPYSGEQKNRKTLLGLKCQCECGSIIYPYKTNVLRGKTTGCKRCQNVKDFTGKKLGKLTVLKRIVYEKSHTYLCRCDCGKEDIRNSRDLRMGVRLSCLPCRFPKKYSNKPKLTRKEATLISNYKKHLKTRDRIIGSKIGLLKIMSISHWEHDGKRRRYYYNARCACKNMIKYKTSSGIKSCGCLHALSMKKGDELPHAKLTNKEALAIVEFSKANVGYNGRQLSKIFQVNETIICNVLSGKTYSCVTGIPYTPKFKKSKKSTRNGSTHSTTTPESQSLLQEQEPPRQP